MDSKFILTMKFWTDGKDNSDRIRNVNYTWNKLKKLSESLKNYGIDNECELFDFSPNQIIDGSTHIPYPLGVYKKAEKTNIILKKYSDYSHMFMFDCDTYFLDEDIPLIVKLLKELPENGIVTFDLAKLSEKDTLIVIETDSFNKEESDFNYAYSGPKHLGPLAQNRSGGLGGVFILPIPLALSLNGFNENYVGWGGEDGDMLDRIAASGKPFKLTPFRETAPIHLSHFADWSNNLYNQRFAQNEN